MTNLRVVLDNVFRMSSNLDDPSIPHSETGPQEACGISAIFSKTGKKVSPLLVPIQDKLQHRGRDAAGIATFNSKRGITVYKNLGRVKEVFPANFDFETHGLDSDRGIGHNRYGTSGDSEKDNLLGAQPLLVKWRGRALAIAYNGNLPESQRQKLKAKIPKGLKGPNFDTVDIALAVVSAEGETWANRIKNGLEGINLAYALTILTDQGEIFGLRCPAGTWPLWVGENQNQIIFASETRVIETDIKWKKVKPGELVEATPKGTLSRQIFSPTKKFHCLLHDAYGARGNSIMTFKGGKPVTYSEFRKNLGRVLAREHPIFVDLYIGIPRTGLTIADGYAEELGKESSHLITLLNNTRSFIGKDDREITAVVNGKYAILPSEVKQIRGRRVLLLDDSLIRGKTTGGDPLQGKKGVVELMREAGADEVHLALILPKFVSGCDLGYYIRENQLVALVKKEEGTYQELDERAIAERIKANSVSYLSIAAVQEGYEWAYKKRSMACMRCMGEPHPLDIITVRDSEEEMPLGEAAVFQTL